MANLNTSERDRLNKWLADQNAIFDQQLASADAQVKNAEATLKSMQDYRDNVAKRIEAEKARIKQHVERELRAADAVAAKAK